MGKRIILLIMALTVVSSILYSQERRGDLSDHEARVERLLIELEDNPGDADLLYQIGVTYHDMANYFGEVLGRKASEYFEKAYDITPTPLIKAYYGSALTLIARDAVNPIVKLDTVARGMKLMDEAIEEDPEDLFIRIIRIQNSYELPDMFNRDGVANEDLDFLKKKYSRDPSLFEDICDPATIFLYKGYYYMKANQLRRAYLIAIEAQKIAEDPDLIVQINEFLESFEE